jgi:putative flippase GtrA
MGLTGQHVPWCLSAAARISRRIVDDVARTKLAWALDPVIAAQFLKFGTVGAICFVADTTIVYSLRGRLGLYLAGVVSYLVVGSANWALNRLWTFRGRSSGARHRQWAKFLCTNLLGFVLNRGTYAILIATLPLARVQPVIAVAAGAVAGMFLNFTLARQVIFR